MKRMAAMVLCMLMMAVPAQAEESAPPDDEPESPPPDPEDPPFGQDESTKTE